MSPVADRDQLSLAERLAAQVRAADTVWACESAEAVWQSVRIIGQSARSGCLADVVARAGKLLDDSEVVSAISQLHSHRLLARLLSSGSCLNEDDETVYVPFALPFLLRGPGRSLRRVSLQGFSESLSLPLTDRLEFSLLNDLYSPSELAASVGAWKSKLGSILVRQLIGRPEPGRAIPPGREYYGPSPPRSNRSAQLAFGVGLIRAQAPSHLLTCLILQYGGPESHDWFGVRFVEAAEKYFAAAGGPKLTGEPLNPVLASHALGAAQAQQIARSTADRARSSFGDMARYRQVRRPGRQKRKVMLYEFSRPAQRLVDQLKVDFRDISDDVPNEELGSILDQELLRLGFRCSSSA